MSTMSTNQFSRISLQQWRTLQAVVDLGGFAQAAEQLNRSQSSVSYAINQLQEHLGLKLLRIEGRKAVLTKAGEMLLPRSRLLTADATSLEQQAHYLEQGWEAEIEVSVEAAYPITLLVKALKSFEKNAKDTRVRIKEVVLSGAEEALLSGNSDLAITPFIPKGMTGSELVQVNFVAVAHPEHPLHQLSQPITLHDLEKHTHIVLSDSGNKNRDSGWINDSRRWSVSNPDSAIQLVLNGLGFGWLPENRISDLLESEQLKHLPLCEGARSTAILHLVYADYELAGPATKLFADILKNISNTET